MLPDKTTKSGVTKCSVVDGDIPQSMNDPKTGPLESGVREARPLPDENKSGNRNRLVTDGGESPYDTKTVRVHEPERGQYMYVMITRFDGEKSILGEIGYGGVYYQFQTMSLDKNQRHADTSTYSLARKHPDGRFTESAVMDLIYGIESETIPWDAISDGDYLKPEDVDQLTGESDED